MVCSIFMPPCVQALCFLAGANSIFDGDKLLTTPNTERSADMDVRPPSCLLHAVLLLLASQLPPAAAAAQHATFQRPCS